MLFGGGAAAVALLIPWLPDPASEQADRIDFVFWFVTTICITIFALVAAVIVYSILKFRARPDDDSDGPPTHGHTGLEIWWTAIPAALVTSISIVSAVVLAKNEQLPNAASVSAARAAQTSGQGLCRPRSEDPLKPLVVCVIAQQFAWLFQYPAYNNATSATLRLPIHTTVQLQLQSRDVIHSFWVPEFGQKQDAVPGLLTKLVITPNRAGTFPVICTELCGLGHAVMRSWTTVQSKDAFLKWAQARGKATGGGLSASAKTFFIDNGCDGCHTFKPAGASGKVGPGLDNLRQAAQKAGQPLDEFIRQSIVDPNAYVAPGYPKGVMPETFSSLPKAQLDALVSYLGGGGQ
jgi:cytochrome c oxidase subunit II